jgi:hypothetical protein
MKLKIINEFGTPLNLQGVDRITVQFPHENGRALEKNNAKVINGADGKIEVELTDFEIQGLKVGLGQNILGEVVIGDMTLHVLWRKGLNVELNGDRKVLL